MSAPIAITGTFDVGNYGDLLFPVLAAHRLAARGLGLVAVSPVGGPPVWPEGLPSIGFDEFAARIGEFGGVLIGGGNIIHTRPSNLPAYDHGLCLSLAYADLWLGAIHLAAGRMPVCWNAPGVPEGFAAGLRPLIAEALARCDYLSVRDRASADRLSETNPGLVPHVVPDTAWDLPAVWSADQLAADHVEVFRQAGHPVPPRSVAVHLNERYGRDLGLDAIAAEIDRMAVDQQATVVLLATGPCHGDDATLRDLAGRLKQPCVFPSPATGLRCLSACLAHASAYVGSSYHGFVVASAYGRPALCIADPAAAKFAGLLDLSAGAEAVTTSWADLARKVRNAMETRTSRGLGDLAARNRGLLDAHWERILGHLASPRPVPAVADRDPSSFRLAVLAEQLRQCAESRDQALERIQRQKEQIHAQRQELKTLRAAAGEMRKEIRRALDALGRPASLPGHILNGFRRVRRGLQSGLDKAPPSGD